MRFCSSALTQVGASKHKNIGNKVKSEKKHLYMDNKTVIHIIEGNPNSGKTVTAWLVYLQLLKKGHVEFFHLFKDGIGAIPSKSEEQHREIATYGNEDGNTYPYDFCAILKIASSRIAVFSAGDNENAINTAFDWLEKINVNVFVGCSRSHGNSYARQTLLAHKDEYRIIFHRVYSDYTTADFESAQRDRLPLAEDIAETILASVEDQHVDEQNIVLQSIRLKKLWNQYDIEWPLNRHINILTGDNGAGKSTLLYTLYATLRNPENKQYIMRKSDGMDLVFSNGAKLFAYFLNDKFSAIKEGAENEESPRIANLMKELVNRVESKYGNNEVENLMVQAAFGIALNHNGVSINSRELLENTKVDLIRTFDVFRYTEEKTVGLKNEQQSTLISELDGLLREALERYAYYIGKLGDQALRIVTEGRHDTGDLNLMQSKDTFLAILDSYLAESGKSVVAKQGKLQFKTSLSSELIDVYNLSSGEKQLLYTLLTILLEEQQNYILIMDEPETSLHVSWQRKLIGSIKELNPNCQIIMATHSPAIIAEGYHSFVTNIEDIRSKIDE